MRKLFILFAAAAMIFAGGCNDEYDDSALNGRVDNLEKRVEKLEEFCRQMNTNISSLQTIVTALQANDYITSSTPLMENGTQIGYTLTLAKSGSIVIYHGQNGKDGANGSDGKDGSNGADGKDGHTPIIGAKTDTDGVIYWTLDGEWLLDENGHKIPVQGRDGQNGADGEDGKDGVDGQPGADGEDGEDGKDGVDGEDGEDGVDGQPGADGKDGITPQLKIEEGYWYISYDNGATWTNLGKATGENGADGKDGQDGADGEAFFQDVTQDEGYVYLTLSTGEKIAIPKQRPLSITFDKTDEICVQANQTYSIGYTLTGADDQTIVKALAQDGFRAVVKKTDNASGTIEITTPATILSSEVLVFVSDGKERTIMCSINFVEGVILITTKSYTVGNEGGTVKIDLSTNLDYTVVIPEADQEWISVEKIESRAMRDETITLNVAANSIPEARYSTIRLVDAFGVTGETLLINQEAGADNTGIVHFADEVFKEYMVENFDKNKDGEISEYEASLITKIDCSRKLIQSLEGIEHCTALKSLECYGNQLKSLDVSKNTALTYLDCRDNQLTALDVSNNTALTYLNCNSNQLTALDVSGCSALTYLKCNSNQLTALDVSNNTALRRLDCGINQLTALDVSNNTALERLECISNQLTTLDLSNNKALTMLICSGNPLAVLNLGEANPGHPSSFTIDPLLIDTEDTKLKVIGSKLTRLRVSGLQSLDISECPALTFLDCNWNQLTALDVSNNTALTYLNCNYNQLTALDVSNNTKLENLDCGRNQLTALDISSNTRLGTLSCNNNQLTALDVSNNTRLTTMNCNSNQLTALDLSKNTTLTTMNCNSNQLTTLDASKNTALERLECSYNPLEVVNLGEANPSLSLDGLGTVKLKVIGTKFTTLDVSGNKFQSLDVSECPALTELNCRENKLTALDVSKNTELTSLDCFRNQLTALDVSNNTALTYLQCSSNQLTTLDVSKTNLGISTEYAPLDCSDMSTLQTLYLKTGWEIKYINVDRNSYYISSQTLILYKD